MTQNRSPLIRPMTPADLPFAASLALGEGWENASVAYFENLYHHDAPGCMLAEVDGQPAGVVVATPYQKNSFIGDLLVGPEFRGRGLGGTLLNAAVDYLHGRGIRSIWLDGVEKATPLYARNGFAYICKSLRFIGRLPAVGHPGLRSMQPADLERVCLLDRAAFADDRSTFLRQQLEQFPQCAWVLEIKAQLKGFILGRTGDGWAAAGACVVADESVDPLPLLHALRSGVGDVPISLGVLEFNSRMRALLHRQGFAPRGDFMWRMLMGPETGLGASPLCLTVAAGAKG